MKSFGEWVCLLMLTACARPIAGHDVLVMLAEEVLCWRMAAESRPVQAGDFSFDGEELLEAWSDHAPQEVVWDVYAVTAPPSGLPDMRIQALPTGDALYTDWNEESQARRLAGRSCGPPAMRLPVDFSLVLGEDLVLGSGAGWIQASGLSPAEITWVSKEPGNWPMLLPVQLSEAMDPVMDDIYESGAFAYPSDTVVYDPHFAAVGYLDDMHVSLAMDSTTLMEGAALDAEYWESYNGLWAGTAVPR